MNKKIFSQLLGYSQNDLEKITQPYILETFGVEVNRCKSLEEYSAVIDDACLHRYFSKYWDNDMKKWKYKVVPKRYLDAFEGQELTVNYWGEKGWDLASTVVAQELIYFYFKMPLEDYDPVKCE